MKIKKIPKQYQTPDPLGESQKASQGLPSKAVGRGLLSSQLDPKKVSLNFGRRHLNLQQKGQNHLSSRVCTTAFLAMACFGIFFFRCTTATPQNVPSASSTKIVSESPDFPLIVEAIRKAENSKKYPYGIRSMRCTTTKSCREIAHQTVKNNYKRWVKAGKPCDFLSFLQRRYAPLNVKNDPRGTNRFWLKNVRFFLGGSL